MAIAVTMGGLGAVSWMWIAGIVGILGTTPFGASWTHDMVINMLNTAFAMTSIPTVTTALLLSPKAAAATKDYFARMGTRRLTWTR